MKELKEFSLAFNILSTFYSKKVDIDLLKKENLLDNWFIQTNSELNKKGKKEWKNSYKRDEKADVYADFTNLFISNENGLNATPYSSYYFNESGETFTKESDDVEKVYKQYGFTPTNQKEPSDFMGSELEFISFLLHNYKTSDDAKSALNMFLSQYYYPWANYCFKSMQRKSDTHFYKGVGYLASDISEFLVKELKIKISKREIYNKG
ncbi:MAG: molecular chaperone [Campylobacteraceae bacterium]